MGILYQSHGGKMPAEADDQVTTQAAGPAASDIAVDEKADFGFLFPKSNDATDYLPESPDTIADLDALGDMMIDQTRGNEVDATVDSGIAPVMTYWGQFLDHELTARSDRESQITSIENPAPVLDFQMIEQQFKNARTPRFDLDSVYGGVPFGPEMPEEAVTIISGLRHPGLQNKMRVGTTLPIGAMPDGLDVHRDLPRYGQVEEHVRQAALSLAESQMSTGDFETFRDSLDRRALIGDMRNDENLVVAQFHLSVLRFHNRVVDFLENNDTGWVADFHSAQLLTRLHYQWLTINSYLRTICDPSIVDRVLSDRASVFNRFRADHVSRNSSTAVGNALPLEFSVAMFRFGHTMVRNVYDYNKNFGRPGELALPNAPFNFLFSFTGNGGLRPDKNAPTNTALPQNWIIDWSRFVGSDPHDDSDGQPARVARRVDTELAPPLGKMLNEGEDHPEGSMLRTLFKHLARRNLRRGFSLRLPTGQALHRHLKSLDAVDSDPIEDVSALFDLKPDMQQLLRDSGTGLHQRTPLWFYCLAEAEAAGGERLGEVGSWIVASTFIGVMQSDPDSALARDFDPVSSPLTMPDNSPVNSIEKWMKFALVME